MEEVWGAKDKWLQGWGLQGPRGSCLLVEELLHAREMRVQQVRQAEMEKLSLWVLCAATRCLAQLVREHQALYLAEEPSCPV